MLENSSLTTNNMSALKEKGNRNKYGPVIEFNAAVDIACAANGRRQLTA